MDYNYYIRSDISLLKDIKSKEDIINHSNKYNFVYFCQNASKEQIDALLDAEGVNILLNSSDLYTKLNGLITCNHDFSCLKNDAVCKKIIDELDFNYIYGLINNSALDFYNYIKQTNPRRLIELFGKYSPDTQIFLLKNMEFTESEINKLFAYSNKKTEKYMLENYNVFLDNQTYRELNLIAENKVRIPIKNISNKLIKNIVSINDVKTYRVLVDRLSNCIDTTNIEELRKKYYEEQLSNVENGLLKSYSNFSKDLENDEFFDEALSKNLGSYVLDNTLYDSFRKKSNEEATKFESDFQMTNMIIDYLFEDIPTNVLININNLLNFQKGEGKTLSDDDIILYTEISNLDKKTAEEKVELFNKLKNLNLKKKFYFDYSKAKDKMVELFNQNMLNKENIDKYKNDDFSKQAGVDVYCLDGDKFMVLIKSFHDTKDEVLNGDIFHFGVDGSSFSIDGSSKLKTFKDPEKYYNLAYTGIPFHQLIHSFSVDSFSKYVRDDKGLPDRIATNRINKLMTPDEFLLDSRDYNELIISVPNRYIKEDNEFNNSLKNPVPFALYCYDTITNNDIETAKKYNLGIIVVNTKKYNINNENKMSMYDTMALEAENSYNYIDMDWDERKVRF